MKKSILHKLIPYIITVVVICFLSFIFEIDIVSGPSMYPTLYDGDIVFVLKQPYALLNKVEVGKIMTFTIEENGESKSIIKRVAHDSGEMDGKVRIPKNMCYILGDNPSQSRDSRYFGPISKTAVNGLVIGHLEHFN